jgi:hypothetical protein
MNVEPYVSGYSNVDSFRPNRRVHKNMGVKKESKKLCKIFVSIFELLNSASKFLKIRDIVYTKCTF